MNTKPSSPLNVLDTIFQRRLKKNPKYSLRAFARDLNTSPGRLSVILAGKEEPGQRFISKVLQCPNLTAEEKNQFESALKNHLGYDETLKPRIKLQEYPSEELDTIEVHSLFCLVRTADCSTDHAWLAKRLGISKEAVDQAIKALLKHGVIVHSKGRYLPTMVGLDYQEKGAQPKRIAQFYQKYLIDTLPSILEMEREHSLFGTIMVALDKEDIPKVQKIMQGAFAKIFALSDKSKRTEVYNLSIIQQRMTKDVK